MSDRLDRLIGDNLARSPEARCFWWAGVWYDQAFFSRLVDEAETTLRNAGFSEGQRLAILMANCPMVPALGMAVWRLGGSLCPLNAKSGLTSIVSALTLLEPFAVVRSPEVDKEVASGLEGRWSCVECPPKGPLPALEGRSSAPESPELAVIFSTSGTTGTPKAVPLTHTNLISNCRASLPALRALQPGDVFLNVLPNFHSFGFTTATILPFILEASQAIVPSFLPPGNTLKAIHEAPVNVVILVPMMISYLVGLIERGAPKPQGIKVLVSGGDRYDTRLDARTEAAMGVGVVEGYGITECSPVLAINRSYERRRLGTVGEFLDGYAWRLRKEDGTPSEGCEGILWVRGPCVTQGYFRVQETDKERFDGDWFNTGDVVRVEDGFIRVVDRATDIVIVGGFNVYPQEVEAVLQEHPAVQAAAVIGVHRAPSTEILKAYVQKNPGAELSEVEVVRYCKERLAHYKVPRKVEFVDSFPLSGTGKVLRRVLREREREAALKRTGGKA